VRSTCKECGGSQICEHKRLRSFCKECGGSQICEHNRQRSTCKDCAHSSFQPGQIIDNMRRIDMMVELDILKVKYRAKETKVADLRRILRKTRKRKHPSNDNVSKVMGTMVAKKRPRVEDIEITMIHDFQITASSYVQV